MDASEVIVRVTLDTFIGQQNIIDTLKISIAAAKMRNEHLGHILLVGEKGSGKSTIAQAIVHEMGADARIVTSNEICKPGEVAAVLTYLREGDLLIVEGFDTLRQDCLEVLCTAMQKFCLEMEIGRGSASRSIRLDLPKFTLIGISESHRGLTMEMKKCFYLDFILADYTKDELISLTEQWCALNTVNITCEAAEKLSLFANGSNRKLTSALKRARDFAQVINNGDIDCSIAEKTISVLTNNEFD